MVKLERLEKLLAGFFSVGEWQRGNVTLLGSQYFLHSHN